MSDKETAAPDSDTDTDADLNDVQAWADVTGQDTVDASTLDSEDNDQNAAVDADSDEHADEARSDDDGDGEGQATTEQPKDVQNEIKRLRGQVGGKDRKIRELQQAIAAERKKRSEAKSDGKPPKDLDELRESYPDLVEPILRENQDIRGRLDALTQSVDKMSELHETSLQSDFAEETQVFRQLRPTGTEIVSKNTDAFWSWVQDQPKKDRDLAFDSQEAILDGEAMADLLNRFETHLGVSAAPNEPDPKGSSNNRGTTRTSNARLAGARTVSSRGSQTATSRPQASETDDIAAWNYVTKGQ